MSNTEHQATFAAIFAAKGKTLVNVKIDSCMGGKEGGALRVVRRTTHKRGYWSRSLTLGPADGSKINPLWRIRIVEYRHDGKIRATTGNMGANVIALDVAGANQ